MLIGTVGNIKNIGNNMNDELSEQNTLLTKLGENVDTNMTKLVKTSGGLDTLLK